MGYNQEPVEVVVLPKTCLSEYFEKPSSKNGNKHRKLKVQPAPENTSFKCHVIQKLEFTQYT